MATCWWVYKQYTFFRPTPSSSKVYRQTFWGSKTSVSSSTIFDCATTKINSSSKPAMWQIIPLGMYYDIQITCNIVYSKFNLKIYILCIQRKYVQFHTITFKMPNSQLLIGLETKDLKTERKLRTSTYISHQKRLYVVTPLP